MDIAKKLISAQQVEGLEEDLQWSSRRTRKKPANNGQLSDLYCDPVGLQDQETGS